jgi:anaerobic selenocysteine-containing dehydrogenase
MKRVGKRGEGKFERISWDQAWTRSQPPEKTIETTATKRSTSITAPGARVRSCPIPMRPPPPGSAGHELPGRFSHHYGPTARPDRPGLPFTFGGPGVAGNSFADIVNSKLVVLFGNNPAATRMERRGRSTTSSRAGRRVTPGSSSSTRATPTRPPPGRRVDSHPSWHGRRPGERPGLRHDQRGSGGPRIPRALHRGL